MPTAEDHSLTRALADDRRARLVDELRSEADGLDVQELARRLGLHANTVRWHLGVLRDAGAVSSTAAPVNGRGRPRILYRLERPLPLARVNDAEATEQVVRLLDDQGFAAEAENGEIRMRRCPFHDLAEAQPDIVCAVHRGLISGALEELGSELEVEGLDVFVEPDLCIAHLARRR